MACINEDFVYDGNWQSSHGDLIKVRGTLAVWHVGSLLSVGGLVWCQQPQSGSLSDRSLSGCKMRVRGKHYMATLGVDGALSWCDGEVWRRQEGAHSVAKISTAPLVPRRERTLVRRRR